MLGRRSDARPVRDLPPLRRLMPYLSPRRNDSLFTMTSDIRVDAAMSYIESLNQDRPADRPLTLFHLFLRSLAIALHARPGVNRFVKGRRLWQRDGVWLTFSAKRELVDGSPVLTVKRRCDPDRETLEEMADGIYDHLLAGRAGRLTTSDREMNAAVRMPGFLLRAGIALLRLADELGSLPRAMTDSDPLFTSAFCANLGSIGLPAGIHHLWEYGTASIFCVIGKVEERPEGRVLTVGWTFDERIADGLYTFIALDGVKERIQDPRQLEARLANPQEGAP